MAIQEFENTSRLPILGKIRLGTRKEAKSGAMYPVTVEHFVLDDAPGVANIYGNDPKELDIIFLNDDLDLSIPTWLKWYSAGLKAPDGTPIGGHVNCVGNGPNPQTGEPGVASYYAKRNHLTREIPTRPCLGEKCSDWVDAKGTQQCKRTMKVICMLPLVSCFGAFQIDTTSRISMERFHSQLRYLKTVNGGVIRFVPFKIFREETALPITDSSGARKVSRQFIMSIRPNETFFEENAPAVQKKLSAIRSANLMLTRDDAEVLLEAPMEDCFEIHDASPKSEQSKKPSVEHLLADQEVLALWGRLESLTGRKYTEKQKFLAMRKKEGEEDFKGAVLDQLEMMINRESALAEVKKPVETSAAIL